MMLRIHPITFNLCRRKFGKVMEFRRRLMVKTCHSEWSRVVKRDRELRKKKKRLEEWVDRNVVGFAFFGWASLISETEAALDVALELWSGKVLRILCSWRLFTGEFALSQFHFLAETYS
eukprot:GHVU01192009.1.p1 GENE.GHVU01192009.1~~GHVU01192009.1.p1  ORF type:complete len:119 (-),score=8.16 GHVU01192009.1:502-858(-)